MVLGDIPYGIWDSNGSHGTGFSLLADSSIMASLALTSAFHFRSTSNFVFHFFLTKCQELIAWYFSQARWSWPQGSACLSVGMQTHELELCLDLCRRLLPVSPANGNLTAWAGEQLDMIMLKPLEDSASYAAPFFPAKSSALTEICVDIKDIHWHLLASLWTVAFPAPVRLKSDLGNTDNSDSTTSPYGTLLFWHNFSTSIDTENNDDQGYITRTLFYFRVIKLNCSPISNIVFRGTSCLSKIILISKWTNFHILCIENCTDFLLNSFINIISYNRTLILVHL